MKERPRDSKLERAKAERKSEATSKETVADLDNTRASENPSDDTKIPSPDGEAAVNDRDRFSESG